MNREEQAHTQDGNDQHHIIQWIVRPSGSKQDQRQPAADDQRRNSVDGGLDYATVTPTEYYDELEIPILSINLKGRSMYFVLKRVINNTS